MNITHSAMRRWRLDRAMFVLSAVFLLFVGAFSYGYFVATTERFPYRIISQALADVADVLDLAKANAHEIRSSRKQGGVTVHKETLTQPGLTFFTAYDGQLFRPFLVDMDGKVVLEGKGDGLLGRVTEATRFNFDGSQFLNKPCP